MENPHTGGVGEFPYPSECREMLLPTLMNSLAFESEHENMLDANFISRYNSATEDFDYFVQRLMGVEMENENVPERGKVWAPFINGVREDWSFICRNNRVVTKHDQVLWRFVPSEPPRSSVDFPKN